MAIKYADLERKLGEIDRARAIYIHSSYFANPNTDKKFWDTWFEFERLHGNLDTAKEMLRIKRSVAHSFGDIKIESNTELHTRQKIWRAIYTSNLCYFSLRRKLLVGNFLSNHLQVC